MSGQDGPAVPHQHAWKLLTDARAPGEDGYFEHVRTELLDLFIRPPRHLLDIGCGTGLTGLEARRRFPAAIVDGVEFSPAAAAPAAGRLHQVHQGDVERMDFGALGYAHGSIDGLLLADVLEHLYYEAAGLLDITHIRFFTRREIMKLFAETGYDVIDMQGSRDGRIPPIEAGEGSVALDTPFVTFKNVDAEALFELTSIQFFVRAKPR
jgi:SAM-dependent methyltransferase